MKKPVTRLLQGAGLSCGSLVVRVAFGLFLTPYMLSVLGDRAFGIFALSSLFAGWCGLLDFGLTTTTSRYVTRYFTRDDWDGVNETGSTAIVLFGGISALVFLLACLAYLGASFLGETVDDTGLLAPALFFAGLSFAISKVSDGYCGVIKGALRQEYTGATSFIMRILFGVVNIVVLWSGGRVVALLAANSALTALQLAAHIALTRLVVPKFRFSLSAFKKSRVRTLFSYSFFAFLAQAGEIAVNRSDLVIIASLMSMTDVARYNLVVIILASYFNSFLTEASSWETNWFAHLAAMERTEEDAAAPTPDADASQERKRVDWREQTLRALGRAGAAERLTPEFYASRATITRASIYAAIFGAFGILIFGRIFVTRWIGAEYLVAFPALAVSIIAQGLYRGSAEVNSRLLQGLARHQPLAIGAIAHGVFNIILSVVFIRLGFGLVGVALGTVIPGLVVHYLWIPGVTCRVVGESRRGYWLRQLHATVVGLLGMAAPAFLVLKYCQPNYLSILLFGALAAALYLPVVYLLGLTREERALAKRLVRKLTARRA